MKRSIEEGRVEEAILRERLSEMLQISLLQQFCAIDTSWQQQCWSTRWCRLLLWGSCKSFSKSSWSSWSSYLTTFSQLLFIKLRGVAWVFAYVYHPKIPVYNLWRWCTKVNFEWRTVFRSNFVNLPFPWSRDDFSNWLLTNMSPPSPSVKTSGNASSHPNLFDGELIENGTIYFMLQLCQIIIWQ